MNDDVLTQAASEFGTPYYLYDTTVIRQQATRLRHCLGDAFKIAVSLKANPNPNLLRLISDQFEYVDVASYGEMLLAQMAGIRPQRLIFVGPGKTREELDYSLSQDVGCIVAENLDEIDYLAQRAASLGKVARVAIRVNPEHRNASSGMHMGGVPSQFGIDEEVVLARIGDIARMHAIKLLGIHVYLGTQNLDADKLYGNFEYILDLAIRLQARAGTTFDLVDFGGGFGVPYFDEDQPLDLERLRSQLQALLADRRARHGAALKARFIVETGRFIFADSGMYCCRVLYRKDSKGRRYCILDGGSNFNSSLSGMGKVLRRNFPFHVIKSQPVSGAVVNGDDSHKFNLAGPLCLPLDTLAINVSGSVPDIGDLVVFHKSGAYGLSFSQSNFLSHLSIQELGYDGDRLLLLKKRKTAELLQHEYDLGDVASPSIKAAMG